jgi:hypothetical protein
MFSEGTPNRKWTAGRQRAMNVDTLFPQAPLATLPSRPLQARADQATARPVDGPHHNKPADNQTKQGVGQNEAHKENQHPSHEPRGVRRESELNTEEKRELEKLKARDREVRAHEAAHKAAAGNLARGGAQFELESGPDGRRYAVGGEVSIDTGKVSGDPQATIEKARTVRRAANAPAQPSSQDRAVAAQASRMEAEARQELTAQETGSEAAGGHSSHALQTDTRFNRSTEPAPVGELIDVLA